MDLKDFLITVVDRADKIANDKNASTADKVEAIRLLKLGIKAIEDTIKELESSNLV